MNTQQLLHIDISDNKLHVGKKIFQIKASFCSIEDAHTRISKWAMKRGLMTEQDELIVYES
ncbi:hypothetical protein [Motilimonas eburnea]|uniref:hypothetical protein n=1 Tax=Motilimonas eburnea TaxID=1737488 RepID=UPI001E46AD66|nr:hypothetical protein [Motilimonas eburnea]MCE2571695.1 hypothetical protein [Motilimonas eburnea]